jgi:hypothetical protein
MSYGWQEGHWDMADQGDKDRGTYSPLSCLSPSYGEGTRDKRPVLSPLSPLIRYRRVPDMAPSVKTARPEGPVGRDQFHTFKCLDVIQYLLRVSGKPDKNITCYARPWPWSL